MKTQTIANFLGDAYDESSKLATRKCYVITDQNSKEGNEDSATVKFETKVIKSIFVIIQRHIFL